MTTTQTPAKSPTFLRKPGVERITQLNPYSSAFIDTLDLNHFSVRKLTDPEPKASDIGWPEVSKNTSGVITNSIPIPQSHSHLQPNTTSFRTIPITKMFPGPPTGLQKYLAATLNVPDIGYGWTGMRGITCYIRESSRSPIAPSEKYSKVRQMMDSFTSEAPDSLMFKPTTDSGYFAAQCGWSKVPVIANLVNVFEVEPGRPGGMCVYTFAVKGVYVPELVEAEAISSSDPFFRVYKLVHFVVCEDLLDHTYNQLVLCPPYFYLYGFIQMYSKLVLEKHNFKITAAGRIQLSVKNSNFFWKEDDHAIQRFAIKVLSGAGLWHEGLMNGAGQIRNPLSDLLMNLTNADWSPFGAQAKSFTGNWKWAYSPGAPGAIPKSPTQAVAEGILSTINGIFAAPPSLGWNLPSNTSAQGVRDFLNERHAADVRALLASNMNRLSLEEVEGEFFADRLARGLTENASTSMGVTNLPYLNLLTPSAQRTRGVAEQTA